MNITPPSLFLLLNSVQKNLLVDMTLPGTNNSSDPKDQLLTAYSVMFYFAGSIITLEPDDDGLPGFCASGLLKNLPVTSRNPDFAAAYELFNAPCNEKGSCKKNVKEHFRHMFAEKESATSWPAESVWCASSADRPAENNSTVDLFYGKYSFSSENESGLPSDHLGIELLFYNKLISGYLNTNDLKAKETIRKDIIAFSDRHLLDWLPAWVKSVTGISGAKCFKGIAHLILASVEDVRSLLVNVSKN